MTTMLELRMESMNQKPVIDDTEYLNSFQEKVVRLEKAADQDKNIEGVTITLDEIWKEKHL